MTVVHGMLMIMGIMISKSGMIITIKVGDDEREVYDAPWMFSGIAKEEWDDILEGEIVSCLDRIISDSSDLVKPLSETQLIRISELVKGAI